MKLLKHFKLCNKRCVALDTPSTTHGYSFQHCHQHDYIVLISDGIGHTGHSLGSSVNPMNPSTNASILINKWGVILVDEMTCQTSKPGVFAAGDAITGGSTVIQAMGQAKKASAGMDAYLRQKALLSYQELPSSTRTNKVLANRSIVEA